MGGMTVTDVSRERIRLLWSTVGETALERRERLINRPELDSNLSPPRLAAWLTGLIIIVPRHHIQPPSYRL